ncbi:hypothetical protein RHOER0001_4853 [Rhodococcus erythropolis SK121]|nr:hypothetical protein RHOER0001_4853 [Rhodococcus erythropolis SK121]
MDCHCRPLTIGSESGSSGSLFAALVSVTAISGQVRFLMTVTVDFGSNAMAGSGSSVRIGTR